MDFLHFLQDFVHTKTSISVKTCEQVPCAQTCYCFTMVGYWNYIETVFESYFHTFFTLFNEKSKKHTLLYREFSLESNLIKSFHI